MRLYFLHVLIGTLALLNWHPSALRAAEASPTVATDTAQKPKPSDNAPATPAQTQKVFKSEDVYVVTDGSRIAWQLPTGVVFKALHQVPAADHPGRFELLNLGKPSGDTVESSGEALEFIPADGKHVSCAAVANPPETIGWQPYELPAVTTDAAKRTTIAKEVQRRFDLEQKLRRDVITLSNGAMDQKTLQRDDVKQAWEKINTTDEDNRAWLEKTWRTDGWIGRKSHGDQANQAVLLIVLHNIQYARFAATALANFTAEFKRGEIPEAIVANVADRIAVTMNEPMQYGIQAMVDESGKPVIQVLADVAKVNANRTRIGQGSLASSAQQMNCRILRIAPDGRLAGEGPGELTGLDALDLNHALQDPTWGLTAAAEASPALAKAIAEARKGKASAFTAWAKAAPIGERQLLMRILMSLGADRPGVDSKAKVVTERPLYDGLLNGMPGGERQDSGIILVNLLAYALVARDAAPTSDELARAVELAAELERGLKRKEVLDSPYGAGMLDTVACVRYRQGKLPDAAELWKRVIAAQGKKTPEIFRKRLAAAEAGDAKAPLPPDEIK